MLVTGWIKLNLPEARLNQPLKKIEILVQVDGTFGGHLLSDFMLLAFCHPR